MNLSVVRESALFQGTVFTGTLVLIAVCILLVLLFITFLLRLFFKRHDVVNRAHKFLIYLLTMAGVLALLIAGVFFSMVPLIPGVVFVFAALLLMRKYHRWRWLDRRMALLTRQLKRTALGKRFFAWRARVKAKRLRQKEERLRRKQQRIQEKLNKLREERQTKR